MRKVLRRGPHYRSSVDMDPTYGGFKGLKVKGGSWKNKKEGFERWLKVGKKEKVKK